MDLHHQFAAQDIGEGFEFQVVLRGRGILIGTLHLGVVLIPGAHVVLRLHQRIPLHGKIAHPGGGQFVAGTVDALGIFAAGKFDGTGRVRKQHGIAACTILVLDDDSLPANHVGGPVQ